MRSLLLAPVLLTLAAAPQDKPTSLGATNYRIDEALARPADARLVWSDEFTRIDPRKWRFDTERNKQGWANNEKQYYIAGRPGNARIENGRLVIEARAEALRDAADWGGQGYSSAKLTTEGHAGWTYGFFEIRAKIPCGRGTWPAIWMMPDEKARWPEAGEIDIMEHVGFDPHQVHATLHSALYVHTKGTQRGSQITVPSACDAFHRYQMDWRPGSITIGVDDRAYMRVRDDQPGGRGAWPFDRRFHLIMNVAMGGDWGGQKGIDDAALPQRMEVDYVRVWQRPR